MNIKIPKDIISKKNKLLKREKQVHNHAIEKTDGWLKDILTFEKERYEFIVLCVEYRLPYEQIAELIGVTKARIYQIYRYGVDGKPYESDKKEIRDRQNDRCLICREKSKNGIKLHIHHVDSPKNKNKNNLVALCPSCHKRVDSINLRAKNKDKFKKVINR